MKIFSIFAGSRLYSHWGSFDTETQAAILYTILAAVGTLVAFGGIKYLIHFYKLPRKEKKDFPIGLIALFVLTYFILHFLFPAEWDVDIFSFSYVGLVSVVVLVLVSLFFVAIVFDDSILDPKVEKKESELNDTDPEVEKKESEEVYRENLKEKVEKTFSSWFSKKPNKKSDIESRLEKLTQLLDDNLISKEEYEEQRKKIIGDV